MDGLIKDIFTYLDKVNWTIVTAESCTGGMIASKITYYPGSSHYFDRGYVTYSNEAKIEVLDVQPLTLERFGAVSEQTARLMARGAYAHSQANVAISVTGIAGPGGGSNEKPVGLVYIALATEEKAFVYKHIFEGNRMEIKQKTTEAALSHLLELLQSL